MTRFWWCAFLAEQRLQCVDMHTSHAYLPYISHRKCCQGACFHTKSYPNGPAQRMCSTSTESRPNLAKSRIHAQNGRRHRFVAESGPCRAFAHSEQKDHLCTGYCLVTGPITDRPASFGCPPPYHNKQTGTLRYLHHHVRVGSRRGSCLALFAPRILTRLFPMYHIVL